ncbi:MAG: hypothetical protein IJ449_04275 [Clostridia bacterium]|nr:hypothetical protein [Clostridia bacterium]
MQYEILEAVYEVYPLTVPEQTPPLSFGKFSTLSFQKSALLWANVREDGMYFRMERGDGYAVSVFDTDGTYSGTVRYTSPVSGYPRFTSAGERDTFLTVETAADHTGYRLLKTDSAGNVLSTSEFLRRPDTITSGQGEVYAIGDDWAVTFFWFDAESFWLADGAITLYGPYSVGSPVVGGFACGDGTLILICENDTCHRFSPTEKTVTPVTLHRETDAWQKSETVLYACDADGNAETYLVGRDGITVQRGNEEIPLCDFTRSYFDVSQFSFVSVLPGDRFLVWYSEPLTAEVTPAILAPTEETVHPVRKTVRLATVGLGSDRRNTVTAAVTQFNRTNAFYVIEHTDYDLPGGTLEQREAVLTDTILRGEHYDVFLFGPASEVPGILADKGQFADLSWIAQSTDFISCVKDAYANGETVYTLPFTVNISTLVTTTDTLAAGTPFTWDVLYHMTETMDDGEILFNENILSELWDIAIYDFVNFEHLDCSFDSAEFEKLLSFFAGYEAALDGTERADTVGNRYYTPDVGGLITNIGGGGAVIKGDWLSSLADGRLKFLAFTFTAPRDAELLYALFDSIGAEYNLCGYPSVDGGSLHVSADMKMALGASGDCADGGAEFLQFLLSREIQGAEQVLSGFPVIRSVAENELEWGNLYYSIDSTAPSGQSGTSAAEAVITIGAWSKTPLPASKRLNYPEDCTVLKPRRDAMLDYLCTSTMRGAGDTVIRTILEEELSYVSQGVRTTEEAAKIIQSRVWIYVNE